MLPVPHRPTTPPRRIGLFGRLIYGNAASQNLAISASMTLCRRDELDATVAMLGVVPGDEALHPSTGLVDVCEAFARIGRRVFQGPEQRFRVRIIVTHRGAAKRRHDAQLLQPRQPGRSEERPVGKEWFSQFKTR